MLPHFLPHCVQICPKTFLLTMDGRARLPLSYVLILLPFGVRPMLVRNNVENQASLKFILAHTTLENDFPIAVYC